MPNTLYASTPSPQPHADLSCPVLVDEDGRAIYRRYLAEQGGGPKVLSNSGMALGKSTGNVGINVFTASDQDNAGAAAWSSTDSSKDDSLAHLMQASAWSTTGYRTRSAQESGHHVYLFPSASEPLREGFVRVINHSAEAGEVTIEPTDDSGRKFDAIALSIVANETRHFNSGDLETGNEGKGLTGSTGSGQGDWRLSFSSDLDIEVLSYIRTEDGFLTAMHDIVPEEEDGAWRIAIFNPASNMDQVSKLRIVNTGSRPALVSVASIDDAADSTVDMVLTEIPGGATRSFAAAELESGNGLRGRLGDGRGKWRLTVDSEQPVVVMSLLASPTGHLTNLSTNPAATANR